MHSELNIPKKFLEICKVTLIRVKSAKALYSLKKLSKTIFYNWKIVALLSYAWNFQYFPIFLMHCVVPNIIGLLVGMWYGLGRVITQPNTSIIEPNGAGIYSGRVIARPNATFQF